jgi:transposase
MDIAILPDDTAALKQIIIDYEKKTVSQEVKLAELSKIIANTEHIIARHEQVIASYEQAIANYEQIITNYKQVIASDDVILAEREAIIADHEIVIAQMQERIDWFKAMMFLAKSEKANRKSAEVQYSLFDEAEFVPQSADDEADTDEPLCEVASHRRRKRGRRPIPQSIPRVDVIIDIPEEEKICPCGCRMTRIGEEVSEKLDFEPAKLQVTRYIRPKWACTTGCKGADDLGPGVKNAPMPPQLIPQGIVSAGLLAWILICKFVDGLPFYRQTNIFTRLGLDISRATMSGWALRAAEACKQLMDLLLRRLRSGPYINMDETRLQVLREPGRENTTLSYMWVARGGPPERPVVFFHYAPSRSGDEAQYIVGDFQGYLQTDGYSGYNALGDKEGIVHVGCLAHVRRKFVDVLKTGGKKSGKANTAQTVINLIASVYALESKAVKDGRTPEAVYTMRQQQIRPILDRIKKLLDLRKDSVPPKSLLGGAIRYALGQWPRIEAYLEDGRLRPDNNLAENAIRPFAVGRKNWLFSGSPRGAKASATLFSLIETAKSCGIDPYHYLLNLFEKLPYAKSEADLEALLP